jgi:DNA adenine methylase
MVLVKMGLKDTKVKTPFRYPGGKFYALKYILPFINLIEHDEYREPFVGGGSVFFGKGKSPINWINDIDEKLIITYKMLQDPIKRMELLSLVSTETASPERYSIVKKMTPKSDMEVAFWYYYMNRTSFSGKMISPSWGYREKRSIPPHRWEEVVIPAGEKLQGAKITSGDFIRLVEKPSDVKVLLYVDPPYFQPPKKKHYNNGFSQEDHLRLMNSLRQTDHAFLLSYEDCEEIRDMYSWAHVYNLTFPYRVGDSTTTGLKRSHGKEVIVSNRLLKQAEQLRVF